MIQRRTDVDIIRELSGRYSELVVELVRRRPAGIYKTALAKLTYLVDLEHFRGTGRSMTGARYRRQMKGPLAVELFNCNGLDGHEISIEIGREGGQLFKLGKQPRFEPLFTVEERKIIDSVLAQFPDPNAIDDLLKAAYSTRPMRRILELEEAQRENHYGADLEFRRGD